tara:strand:- start:13232 stop:14032 length:801 start_codon:yes stop_codon:yes gene_type:complete
MNNLIINKIKNKIEDRSLIKYILWKMGLIKLFYFLKDPMYIIKLCYLSFVLNVIKTNNTEKLLEYKFKLHRHKKSDIYEHMDLLYTYSLKCQSIFETGVRGVVSSWAFLKGLNDNNFGEKTFVMNDINYCNTDKIQELSTKSGIDFLFVQKNNLSLDLNRKFDLTFIDTWHVYGQLKRELQKFSLLTNKYIILHDTTIDGEFGESLRFNLDVKKQSEESGFPISEIEKGLWPAVEEFINDSSEWILEKRLTNCNGLTILKRINQNT